VVDITTYRHRHLHLGRGLQPQSPHRLHGEHGALLERIEGGGLQAQHAGSEEACRLHCGGDVVVCLLLLSLQY